MNALGNVVKNGFQTVAHATQAIFAKATYEIKDGELQLAEEQAPLVLSDTYHGEMNFSSLWIPSDLVPRTASTDILFNAVARSPESMLRHGLGQDLAKLCEVLNEPAGQA
jgi:hypothetical protein